MYSLIEWYDATRDFLTQGGPILTWIAWLMFFMWVLIIERVIYLRTEHKKAIRTALETWESRPERSSWNARQIRDAMISRVKLALTHPLSLIQTCVALCPLLGLLGTVTGMITVFDVMAISGTGNARSMASGVSMATIPTMAGMVGALSGVFAITWLVRKAEGEIESLKDHMTLDH
ncbi:MAG: MotA/TolQ/ExbB proton channel family protein [Gammaproteobacteria bacterium]|nr:MotA/TolQ/ExbB proton channel family protein [Gammaproteobacteria bacterium]